MTTPTNPPAVCPFCGAPHDPECCREFEFSCGTQATGYQHWRTSDCKDRQISLLTAKLAEVERRDRWILVAEKMPAPYQSVMVADDAGVSAICYWSKACGRWFHINTIEEPEKDFIITKWRLLP